MSGITATDATTGEPTPNLSERHQLKPGIETCRVGASTIATLDGSIHLSLNETEATLLDELREGRTCEELAHRYGQEASIDLIEDLAEVGFLVGSEAAEEPPLAFSREGIEFSGSDRVVRTVDGALGNVLSRRSVLFAGFMTVLAGLGLLLTSAPGAHTFSGTTSLAVLTAWTVIGVVPHELAHALVLHRSGRRVGRAGFGLHWGAIALFVDATDAFFLPRRTRLAQTLAGPFTDAVIAGGMGITAWLLGPGAAADLLVQIAILNWISVLINLSPLLELDGQHALEDLLDETDLHTASLQALRQLGRDRTPRARRLAIYGLVAVAIGAAAIAVSGLAWTTYYVPLIAKSWGEGPLGQLTAALFVGPTLAATLAWALHRFPKTLHRGR